uniref:Uncharacterized protein n=1 Tax=Arundo donax TaxID=35708 RepID=A0A0A9A301_ARUDO
MEGNNSRLQEITVDKPVVVPASGGSVLRVAKLAGKKPTTLGTPSPATVWRGSDGAVGALPAWKLDCLCGESSLPPAVKGGFLCF